METMLADPKTGDMTEAPSDWGEARARAFTRKMGLLVHKRPGRRVRWTVSADQARCDESLSITDAGRFPG